MKQVTLACGLTLAAAAATAESFYLKSTKTDRMYGPFEYRNGALVTIGRAGFTVLKEDEEGGAAAGEAAAVQRAKQEAVAAAQAWLALLDGDRFEAGWLRVAGYMKKTVNREQFLSSLARIRQTLGGVEERVLQSANYRESMPSAPDGRYVVLRYRTRLERKQSAVETVIPVQEADGQWRISGYDVR